MALTINHPRLVPFLAFIAGVVLTLGFKDVYPDLERRFRRRRRENASRLSVIDLQKLYVTDNAHTTEELHASRGIVEGIEGCIGNTPLIRIKSLSEETGCEILAKTEVSCLRRLVSFLSENLVSEWRWGQS